eukprot:TRINITY_DN215_c0_g4_i2.p1 TRINITY_DN215_c0_g4~~TRINITY_DN215_c0_g4_i2.p1  ORF type:complete len:811 (-),score=378.17 TRINITY_DN215_c0_g4_i2:114-2546(-)
MSRQKTMEELWPILQSETLKVLNFRSGIGLSIKDWISLYTQINDYCTNPRQVSRVPPTGANILGEEIYLRLCDFIQNYVKELFSHSDLRSDEDLLNYYCKHWQDFNLSAPKVSNIYNYLNRYWIKRVQDDGRKNVYEINIMCLIKWRTEAFEPLKSRLIRQILHYIECDRKGEVIDISLLAHVIRGIVTLGSGTAAINSNSSTSNSNSSNNSILASTASTSTPASTPASTSTSTPTSNNNNNNNNNSNKALENSIREYYSREFEVIFLQATEEFYITESSNFLANNSVTEYLKKVETRFIDEERRVDNYLHQDSRIPLIKRCEAVLIEKHKEIIQGEFQRLLKDDKIEDLTRLYSLLCRIKDGLTPLRSQFEQYVQQFGMDAIQRVATTANQDAKLYIDELLKVYVKFNDLLLHSFRGDKDFAAALDRACRRFINDNAVCKEAKSASKSAELLARFSDATLKKNSKNSDEKTLENLLDDIMVIFKYIEEKDIFMTCYSRHLSKRLIYGTSASEDLESTMIGKLKSTCGYEYTSKLQRMFTDISLSKAINESFKKEFDMARFGVDFSVLVLATGSWPLQPPSSNFTVPNELQQCFVSFQEFYGRQHSGRKLNWLHQLSKAELKTNFTTTNKTGYTFQVTGYQLGILIAFNSNDNCSGAQLQEITQLVEPALFAALQPLLKLKILARNSSLKDEQHSFNKSDVYTLNSNFKSPRIKVNISGIRVEAEEKKIQNITQREVDEDRKWQIQAAIVRVMKMRKSLRHTNLVAEVVNQLQSRFKPPIPLIKKCIDALIEKEYLQRVESEKDLYQYLA